MNELTEAHCTEFDSYMAKWQQKLNLQDWRIERAGRRSKYMAEVLFDTNARLANYRIGVDFGPAKVTPDSLERTALHELLHVFLHDVLNNWSEASEHQVINVLEKLLMEMEAKK